MRLPCSRLMECPRYATKGIWMVCRLSRLRVGLFACLGFVLVACGSSSNSTGTGGRGGAGGSTGGHGGTSDGGVGGRGVGGSTGVGGGGGSVACLAPRYTHVSPFGAILDSWGVANNSTPPSLAPAVVDGSMTGTQVDIDPLDGSPVAGSVKLTIPFDGPNQE